MDVLKLLSEESKVGMFSKGAEVNLQRFDNGEQGGLFIKSNPVFICWEVTRLIEGCCLYIPRDISLEECVHYTCTFMAHFSVYTILKYVTMLFVVLW